MLVYELCENGSLDDRLFPGRCFLVAGQLSEVIGCSHWVSFPGRGAVQWCTKSSGNFGVGWLQTLQCRAF